MHVMDVGVVIQHRQHLQTQLLLYPTPHLTSLSYTKVASRCDEMLKRPTKNIKSLKAMCCVWASHISEGNELPPQTAAGNDDSAPSWPN
jgi:hypothetical protein